MTQVVTRPSVSGPLSGGRRGWAFGASTLDVAAYGYLEAEYTLEGTATRYRLAPGAELSRMAAGASSRPARRRFARACSSTGRATRPASTAR